MIATAGAATPELEPLRGEIYSLHHLVEHARSLAAAHAVALRPRATGPLLQDFAHSRDELLAAYRQIEAAAR